MDVSGLLLLLTCGLLIAFVLVTFLPTQRSRTNTNASTDHRSPDTIFRDDERYWIAGLIYYNPDDPGLIVPKRFGYGLTVNVGRPLGKLFVIGPMLLPLVAFIVKVLSRQ